MVIDRRVRLPRSWFLRTPRYPRRVIAWCRAGRYVPAPAWEALERSVGIQSPGRRLR